LEQELLENEIIEEIDLHTPPLLDQLISADIANKNKYIQLKK